MRERTLSGSILWIPSTRISNILALSGVGAACARAGVDGRIPRTPQQIAAKATSRMPNVRSHLIATP